MCIFFIKFICLIHFIHCIAYMYKPMVYLMYFMNILLYICIVFGHVQVHKHLSLYNSNNINIVPVT
jgi:hypothetical protein